MPSLEELIDAEGYYELGTIDGTMYCWMDIVVALGTDGTITPVCMKDDWQKTQQFAIIEARREIADLTDTLFALRRELIPLQERANRVAWLESEVSRLTADLQGFREQEAAQRTLTPRAWNDVMHETNSHIAPEAPIFRKLCQCDACREIRIHSGYAAAEIEGH